MKRTWRVTIIALALLVQATLPALGAIPRELEIKLLQARPPMNRLVIAGPVEVILPRVQSLARSQYNVTATPGRLVILEAVSTGGRRTSQRSLLMRAGRIALRSPSGVRIASEEGTFHRTYSGTLFISSVGGKLQVTNRVPARDYVAAVLGSEMPTGFPLEALKAQAVLIQTFLFNRRFSDLNDTTEGQAYMGMDYARPDVKDAVDSVWEETLTYEGSPARVYFHSTCAGGTSNGARYFELKRSIPYLVGVKCDHCQESPFWEKKVASIPVSSYRHHFKFVPVVRASDDVGRPLLLQMGPHNVGGYGLWVQFGQKLGWDKVPGTRYSAKYSRTPQTQPRGQRFAFEPAHWHNPKDPLPAKDVADGSVVIESNGAGHGVGLCQWGACGLAKKGKTYRDILRYYFPGTSVSVPRVHQSHN